MTESLKVILAKKAEDLTDDDRKEILEAVNSFKKAVEDVCREHGFAYKAIVSVTPDGIAPLLDIVQVKEEETK